MKDKRRGAEVYPPMAGRKADKGDGNQIYKSVVLMVKKGKITYCGKTKNAKPQSETQEHY